MSRAHITEWEVYRTPRNTGSWRRSPKPGDDLADYVASMPGVQNRLAFHAKAKGQGATRRLAAHRHEGAAHIEVTHGRIDHYVEMVDGDENALTIEYGRAPALYPDGSTDEGSEGTWVLHETFGLPHQGRRARRARDKNRTLPPRGGRRGKDTKPRKRRGR